jgi:uncharacterized protein YlxW (UPF0749 family)
MLKTDWDDIINQKNQLSNMNETQLKELLDTQATLTTLQIEFASLSGKFADEQSSVAEKDQQIEMLTEQLRTMSQEKNRYDI